MNLKYFVSFFCFLIISCDLPNEVEADCNGVSNGIAEVDECGVCSGGTTGIVPNSSKDCNGVCNGNSYLDDCNVCDSNSENDGNTCETECSEQGDYECFDGSFCWNYSTIEGDYCDCDNNTIDGCGVCNGLGFINCMCNYVDSEGKVSSTQSASLMPYTIGDQLTSIDIDVEFETCYPEDCGDVLTLSDFDGRVFWIIYEEDW